MSAPAYIPIFGDAYLADTQHLTLEEHGAYFKLLLVAWRTDACELPDDDKRIAVMLGVTLKKWLSLRPTVLAFWTRTETGWQQLRLTKERRHVEKSLQQKSDAAVSRWGGKYMETNEPADAAASPTAVRPDIPLTPSHRHIELEASPLPQAAVPPAAKAKVEVPDWVPAEPWKNFVAMRRASKAAFTVNAAKLILVELGKLKDAGEPPGEVLDQSTRNGWRDVFAIKDRQQNGPRNGNGMGGHRIPPVAQLNPRIAAGIANRERLIREAEHEGRNAA